MGMSAVLKEPVVHFANVLGITGEGRGLLEAEISLGISLRLVGPPEFCRQLSEGRETRHLQRFLRVLTENARRLSCDPQRA
jgi:hypothetical protein